MTDIKKFGYAVSNLFSLTGSDYTGYYNILDGNAYTGKYTQVVKLNNYDNVYNVFTRSDLFLNRLQTENFTLTYNLSDFTFQPGEYINSNSFDNKLQKAFINYLDTFRACFMASSKLPYNLTAVGLVSATSNTTQLVWNGFNTSTTSISSLSTLNSNFKRDSKILFIKGETTPTDTLVIATSSYLLSYRTQPYSTFAIAFSSNYIETNTPEYGALEFGKISSISNFGNTLYVCDNIRASIYQYDISSVVENDRALGYKFNLTNSVNSTQGSLVSPTLVSSSQNTVYVYDSSTQTIVYFDVNFNLKNSYKNSKLFTESPPVSITYYQLYDQLYVLTSNYTLIILDTDANATIIKLNTDNIVSGESPIKLEFSNSNSDVVYLLTSRNLYKKFVSSITGTIGNYSFVQGITGRNATNTGDVLYDMSIQTSGDPYDNILLYGFGQLINYREVTVFNSILK